MRYTTKSTINIQESPNANENFVNFRLFLYDLIETIHYFVKMIEVYSMKTPIVVQKRTRKGGAKKKKQKGKKNVEKTSQTLSGSQKEELWDEIADELSAALKGDRELPDDVVPFDSLLEKEEEKKSRIFEI